MWTLAPQPPPPHHASAIENYILFLTDAVHVVRAQDARETQGLTFEGFEFKLPSRFEEVPIPAGRLPDFMRLKPYQVKKDGEVVEAVMMVRNNLGFDHVPLMHQVVRKNHIYKYWMNYLVEKWRKKKLF